MARRGHPVFDLIVDKLCPAPGETIVDLGCGQGPALHALRTREPTLQLVGLDLNDTSIASVLAELPGARAETADLNRRLPLVDQSVDAVLSHNVLECLEDPLITLDEAARVLRPGGRAVWSHTDFDGIVISGPEQLLTRKIVHAYADHPPPWAPTANGQMGRQLVGLVRRSQLRLVDLAVHLTTSTEVSGDARARVDELASALHNGIGDLGADQVLEWRRQIDVAERHGEFLFCEPCFVVTTAVADTPNRR